MENEEEAIRLDLKTDPVAIKNQALWAGIAPGMRTADLGCGPGKTSYHLNQLVQPHGSVLGLDISPQRIDYAAHHYQHPELEFKIGDIREPLDDLGDFDFIWVRFVLEYYPDASFDIVKNISRILKPGGIMCLIDLDHNCLSHYGVAAKLEKSLFAIMDLLQSQTDFDPYAGRKLYTFLYDLGYDAINVEMSAHHLIFGLLNDTDAFNWNKKVEIAARASGYGFDEYEGGFDGFLQEFRRSFADPRRFTYTPVICVSGRKPQG
jgi:ubiquinone/menaquinone biosynthesis C-methylase UbiE